MTLFNQIKQSDWWKIPSVPVWNDSLDGSIHETYDVDNDDDGDDDDDSDGSDVKDRDECDNDD